MGLQHRDIEMSDRIDSCRSGSSVATGYPTGHRVPDSMCGSVKTLHKPAPARLETSCSSLVIVMAPLPSTTTAVRRLSTKLVSQIFFSKLSGAIQILRSGCQAAKQGGRDRCTLQKTAAREFRHAQILLRRSYGAPTIGVLSSLEGCGRSEHDTDQRYIRRASRLAECLGERARSLAGHQPGPAQLRHRVSPCLRPAPQDRMLPDARPESRRT